MHEDSKNRFRVLSDLFNLPPDAFVQWQDSSFSRWQRGFDYLMRCQFPTINNIMKHPINHLKVYLTTLETNEPINRSEGNVTQADLEAKAAMETRLAIEILERPEFD